MADIKITEQDLILVTGGTGYLATHVVSLLLEQGFKVRATVRNLQSVKTLALKKLCQNSKVKSILMLLLLE